MTAFLAFIAALAAAVFVLDLLDTLGLFSLNFSRSRLEVQVGEEDEDTGSPAPRLSTWAAFLAVLFPRWFSPDRATGREKVIALIRRAGYQPYGSVGEFYTAAMMEFGKGIIIAAMAAVAFYLINLRFLTIPVAIALLWMAYRKPYANLRQAAKKRAELMRPNMLAGLSQLESLLQAGIGVQEALRRTAQLGGPFCNLMGLLVARLEVESPSQALKHVFQHIPDPTDTNMVLFLRDLEDYFLRQRPLDRSVSALRRSVHQEIVNATIARASKVKQTAGLFGIIAIVGMLVSALAPIFRTP